MARRLTEEHQNMAATVWQLAERRAALQRQLAETDLLHREAISLAATYGVPQSLLGALSDLSQPRIAQIVRDVEPPAETNTEFRRRVYGVMERPQDQLKRLATSSTAGAQAESTRKYELIYGPAKE